MPWFKVDDSLAFHAKVMRAGNAAMGLWVRAGSYAAQHLTDGRVERHVARTLGTAGEARRLVDVGLWVEHDDGYVFHEWDERQPSRVDVLDRRQREAERKAEWRRRRADGHGKDDD